jgi:hypothetical protein
VLKRWKLRLRISKAMKEVVSSAIQSAMRPGGCLSTALKSDASFKVAGGRIH